MLIVFANTIKVRYQSRAIYPICSCYIDILDTRFYRRDYRHAFRSRYDPRRGQYIEESSRSLQPSIFCPDKNNIEAVPDLANDKY